VVASPDPHICDEKDQGARKRGEKKNAFRKPGGRCAGVFRKKEERRRSKGWWGRDLIQRKGRLNRWTKEERPRCTANGQSERRRREKSAQVARALGEEGPSAEGGRFYLDAA